MSSRVLVFNGWAAGPTTWSLCTFPRDRTYDYLEQLDGVHVREAAEMDSYVLVGFSMGGSFALRLLLSAPEKVRGLVLVSTTARMMEDPATGWKGMSLRRRAALKYGTQLVFKDDPSPLFAEANLDRGLDYLQATDLRAELAALPQSPAWERLSTIPVWIFQSERDGIVRPSNAAFLKACFPQATVAMVPGGEHVLPAIVPEQIDAAVTAACQGGDALTTSRRVSESDSFSKGDAR